MNRHLRPGLFFGTVFILTGIFWSSGAVLSSQPRQHTMYSLVMLAGLISPCLVSLFMILRHPDADIKKRYAARLFNLHLINLRITLLSLLLMPVIVVCSALQSILSGGPSDQLQPASGFSFSGGDIIPVISLLLLAAVLEELGWRGYAFDSLAENRSFIKASLLFSILWSLWHIPLLAVSGSYQNEILQQSPWYALNFFISIIPMGIIISWFCIRNNGSIPAAMLFHFTINLSQEMLNIGQQTKCIETILLILSALLIVTWSSGKGLVQQRECSL